jgi:hypothetical protein
MEVGMIEKKTMPNKNYDKNKGRNYKINVKETSFLR